ncbi:hypothetical protein BV25DRAFT_1843023 [Artomyces pyxidatus]|uniref:Uncharacterized protein n=1 Tax=Artomyces pyxidatus TaxID=48021 RepID=A0ACB8SH15_9AGAM|nr:hypothetical protein BV25DRAFT_1843023 [Artomyces pyxidatus]
MLDLLQHRQDLYANDFVDMTQTQPAEDPEYVRLPSWTNQNIPGVDTYYGLANTKFRRVYTNWLIVGPVVHGIHSAECVRYRTYEAALEAINGAQQVRNLLTQMQNASIDPMRPATAIAALQSLSPAVSSAPTDSALPDSAPMDLLTAQPSRVMTSQAPPPPLRTVGRERGIFATAKEMEAKIKGYPNARGQGFRTKEEALEWLEQNPE